ncbi:MAG: hypothetical protein QXX08_04270 [Candidatus Bathyarchaeia archaeon]
MSETSKFPERVDLSYQGCKAVKSRKTGEDLLVIEARDPKTGTEYSLWIRRDILGQLLSEIGLMLDNLYSTS